MIAMAEIVDRQGTADMQSQEQDMMMEDLDALRLEEPPNSFSNRPAQYERSEDRRTQPHREGPGDSDRGGRGNNPADDYRGARREGDGRDGGRAPREFEGPPASLPNMRKRRHEDAPAQFDDSKRRRSGR